MSSFLRGMDEFCTIFTPGSSPGAAKTYKQKSRISRDIPWSDIYLTGRLLPPGYVPAHGLLQPGW